MEDGEHRERVQFFVLRVLRAVEFLAYLVYDVRAPEFIARPLSRQYFDYGQMQKELRQAEVQKRKRARCALKHVGFLNQINDLEAMRSVRVLHALPYSPT